MSGLSSIRLYFRPYLSQSCMLVSVSFRCSARTLVTPQWNSFMPVRGRVDGGGSGNEGLSFSITENSEEYVCGILWSGVAVDLRFEESWYMCWPWNNLSHKWSSPTVLCRRFAVALEYPLQDTGLGRWCGRRAVAHAAGRHCPYSWCNPREGQEPMQLGTILSQELECTWSQLPQGL